MLVEQVPRIGKLEHVEALDREMTAMVEAVLRARRYEIAVADVELGAFVVVGIVESLTHAAVLSRPELLGEAFVREVTAAVYRYLKGGAASREE